MQHVADEYQDIRDAVRALCAAFAHQGRSGDLAHGPKRFERIGGTAGDVKLLLGADNHIKKMQYLLQLTGDLIGGDKTCFAVA